LFISSSLPIKDLDDDDDIDESNIESKQEKQQPVKTWKRDRHEEHSTASLNGQRLQSESRQGPRRVGPARKQWHLDKPFKLRSWTSWRRVIGKRRTEGSLSTSEPAESPAFG
jgi:hypothetical protein